MSNRTTKPTDRRITLGPPVHYRPVCYLTPWGFIGGPWGYRRADTEEEEEESAKGPIIVDQFQSQTEGS